MMAEPETQPVTVSLQDLANGTVSFETLHRAFGPDSLGILIVNDLPAGFAHLRRLVLSHASYLAALPQPELDKLERPETKYLTGWSRGKEKLKSGQADTLKGSFYANCAFYVDDECAPRRQRGPDPAEYLAPNVWPPADLLPGFRPALEDLCRMIIDVAVLVARACDGFAQREIQAYEPGYLARIVAESTTTKARLLHYFPPEGLAQKKEGSVQKEEGPAQREEDDWCAMHVDHGCLTGLTSAMFVDETAAMLRDEKSALLRDDKSALVTDDKSAMAKDNKSAVLRDESSALAELPACPDADAGLYIKSRTGRTVHVRIPRDSLAFQTGEALERITAGRFKAVPHFVRGVRPGLNVARNTLAVFTQPNLDDVVDVRQNLTFAEFARRIVAGNTVS